MNLTDIYHKWSEENTEKFLGLLEKNPNSEVIDLGCGKGDFTVKVKERIGCDEIFGVDTWRDGISESEGRGIKIIKNDLNKKLKIQSNSFDVVVSNQVIEHLIYPEVFVKEIYRILKKGGYAVISTENLSSWDNIISLLMGYIPFSMQFNQLKIGNPFTPHKKVFEKTYNPHTRIFTYKGLMYFFDFFKFKVEKMESAGHIVPLFSVVDKIHTRFITIKVRK